MAPSERDDVRVELDTDVNVADGLLGESRHEDGARVLSGLVELARKTSSRLLVVRVPNQPTRLFRVALWPFWNLGGIWGLYAWRWLTTFAAFGLAYLTTRRNAMNGQTTLRKLRAGVTSMSLAPLLTKTT